MSGNVKSGPLIIKLIATHLNNEINQEVTYFFQNCVPANLKNIFTLGSVNREMRTVEKLDFETVHQYENQAQASDKGSHPVMRYCMILIDVHDVNDNAPEIWLKSLLVVVSENAVPGMVALINVLDQDSGINRQVSCSMCSM